MDNFGKIPVKKQADLLKIITYRPANFLFINKKLYLQFLARVAKL